MQTAARIFLLAAGFLAAAIFYYWMNWSAEVPILGGDHAVYFLMADQLGITGGTSAHIEIAHAMSANQAGYHLASVIIGSAVVYCHSEALNRVI